jgi:radical SAM superfamily enzyme YgiQ (UPF0313 family)
MAEKSKITLISPYEINIALGIRSISSYLKSQGHQVNLVFLALQKSNPGHFHRGMYSPEVMQDLIQLCGDSDLVGFTLMTNYFLRVRELTRRVKKELDVPVAWGGIHPTLRPEESLQYADIVCLGEGEEAALDLADRIKSGGYEDIPNIWIKKNGRIIKNPIRPLEHDLDKYPFQDYDYSSHYILKDNRILPMDRELFKFSFPREDETGITRAMYHVYTVRNCPHDCTYCSNSAMKDFYRGKGPFVRKRSLNNVIREIKEMTDQYDFIQNISILDETFFVRTQKEIETFSRLYREEGINRAISCSLSPHTLTDGKLKPLVEAGLFRVSVGIQSLSGRTLQEIYNRPTPMSLIKKTIHLVNKYNNQVRRPVYHLIVDNPYESKESLKTSIEFVMSLPARTKFNIYPLVLYPGTELYNRAKRDGFIRDEIKEIYMKSWTIDDVQDLDFLTMLVYYAVWAKFSKPVMLVINRMISILLNDRMIKLLDRKIVIKGMLYSLKFFIFILNQGRKIKKIFNRG